VETRISLPSEVRTFVVPAIDLQTTTASPCPVIAVIVTRSSRSYTLGFSGVMTWEDTRGSAPALLYATSHVNPFVSPGLRVLGSECSN
jgi:hypothetical protein